ncbi:DUF3280 domain-containing protein [Paraburkholderia sp. BR14320]|uniref:DUF3280 domain-containing protein n=1 Tax=unclassified Paraburkholderia TaxID=2615204 RepID=UPI0034CDC9AB
MRELRAWRSFHQAAFVRCAAVLCVGFAGFFVIGVVPARAEPVTIAVLNCGLIDDNAAYNDADTNRVQAARIEMVSNAVRAQLDASQRYRVADNGRASELIARLGAAQDLTTCDGCARQVGRALGVEQVGVCWVQKVSNLILNLNLRVEDVASGRTLFQRSVDIRGNTDLSWRRGASALVGLLMNDA